MPTRRIIKSVLEGFLGTYTSRCSDLRGYWLHGQLPFDTSKYDFDLLAAAPDDDTPDDDTPDAAARRLAVRRFREQVEKSGLNSNDVRSASLTIERQSEIVERPRRHRPTNGHLVTFVATAVMDNGYRYQRQRTVFVAPHDPDQELRRARTNWGEY